jgi:DNA-binding transcriptional ArsR family regulator
MTTVRVSRADRRGGPSRPHGGTGATPPRRASLHRASRTARTAAGAGAGRLESISSLTYISHYRYYGSVHAFDVLGDPVRRRILELLAEGEQTSGAVCAVIRREFGISQPAVSQHLKVLRDSGFATVRPEGTRRLYAVNATPLREVDDWLDRFRQFWAPRLDALATELARGKRQRRLDDARGASEPRATGRASEPAERHTTESTD